MKHKNYYDYRVSTKFKEKANAYSSQFNALECQNQTNITLTKLTKQNKYSLIHITPRLILKIVLERNSKMNTKCIEKTNYTKFITKSQKKDTMNIYISLTIPYTNGENSSHTLPNNQTINKLPWKYPDNTASERVSSHTHNKMKKKKQEVLRTPTPESHWATTRLLRECISISHSCGYSPSLNTRPIKKSPSPGVQLPARPLQMPLLQPFSDSLLLWTWIIRRKYKLQNKIVLVVECLPKTKEYHI